MKKFQVGDKVRILKPTAIMGAQSAKLRTGDVVSVVALSEWGSPKIETPRAGSMPLIIASHELGFIELVKEESAVKPLERGDLRKGDKVKIANVRHIIGGYEHFDNGDIAVVSKLDSDGDVFLTSNKREDGILFIANSELHALERHTEGADESRLAEILTQIEALANEARQLAGTATNNFSELERKADEDVAQLEKRMAGFSLNQEGNHTFRAIRTTVTFQVNRRKRAVTAVVKGEVSGDVKEVGIARCHTEDTFSESIGKAIALRRALGLRIPSEYTTLGGM